jgi:hypothetical protein
MPDRITNTINLASGGTCKRPTVINAYDGGVLDSIDSWWQLGSFTDCPGAQLLKIKQKQQCRGKRNLYEVVS